LAVFSLLPRSNNAPSNTGEKHTLGRPSADAC